jgi:hypothetical protein
MPTADPTDLIDAIAADLLEHVTLPEYLDWRHAPPAGLSADNTPWLAIWLSRTAHRALGVDGDELVYADDHQISVQWAEQAVDTATVTAGISDDAADPDVVTRSTAIQRRLATYAARIPGLDSDANLEATLADTIYGSDGAAITATTTLTVTQTPA